MIHIIKFNEATFNFEKTFNITKRGTVMSGSIVDGEVSAGDTIMVGDKPLLITGINYLDKKDGVEIGLSIGDSSVDLSPYIGKDLKIVNCG